jgi:predicted metal-dependent enzyme (double-stranded beta helix superfamily)
MSDITRLRAFVVDTARLLQNETDEAAILAQLAPRLEDLIRHDDWLPEVSASTAGDHYRQHLLYADPLDRFSIVSFVWGPGQGTPVHDHRVWGLVGVLRGEERAVSYARQPDGRLQAGPPERLRAGQTAAVSPQIGDIRSSISIHVYGGNIGTIRRSSFDAETGAPREFISGYSNDTVPNLWSRRQPATA